MFANPILTESAGVNRHLFFSTFNYEWDRLRMGAERFMIDRIADPAFVAEITAHQTQILIEKFEKLFCDDQETITTLYQVALMTPENIHVNSFMYEPIVDMSDDHLRKLYRKIKALHGLSPYLVFLGQVFSFGT